MSSFNTIAAEDFGFMLSEFGEERTRTPASGDPVQVLGIWEPEPPELDEESGGRRTVLKGKLSIPSSETVLDGDQWTVDGEVWQTELIGANDGGMRVIHLRRDNKQRTKRLVKTI